MITTKITLHGCDYLIVPQGFEFVNQSCVKFYGFRLSKKQLLVSCEYLISTLKTLGYSERLKCGFNLKCFNYYELSVYLHGLLSLYCSHLEFPCPSCFGLTRFSHLPHEVLKPEKVKRDIKIYLLDDFYVGRYYVTVINGKPVCSHTLLTLKAELFLNFPSLRDYELNFIIN